MGAGNTIAVWLKKHRKALFIAGVLWLAAGVLFWRCLPANLFSDPLSRVLFSADQQLLSAVIASDEQWRFPFEGLIPEKFKQALIQFEDKRFHAHLGCDPLALARALHSNLKSGKTVSGGSTISMQVIRLSRKNKQRTVWEKLIEILMALRMELSYSKQEILGLYAANAPFGGNIVGLPAASWFYFQRNMEQLSWGEAAFLAVIPNHPNLIGSGKKRDILLSKRNFLLKKLYRKKMMTALEYELAVNETLPQKIHRLPNQAPHLLDTLCTRFKSNDPQKAFHSTLQFSLQNKLRWLCEDHFRNLHHRQINNLAAMIIDNRSSEVVAYVGNTALNRNGDAGQAVDIIQCPRSTGSILKPFLYALMLHSGQITPQMLVADIPTQYGGFIPENFDLSYHGSIQAKQALAYSLNVPAVRMLKTVGLYRFYNFLKKNGMTTLKRPADSYGLTLVLGGAEGTLFDITGMYAHLAQLAHSVSRCRSIRWLKNEAAAALTIKDMGTGAAYLTIQALLEVARPGNDQFWRSFPSARKIAWKTGTSYGLRDAWAIGLTPEYTVGVWAGNASGEGQAGLTGIAVAAPVLFDIFNGLEANVWFEKPLSALKTIKLCSQSGYLASEWCQPMVVSVPQESGFDKICPFHQLIHLDAAGVYRVDSRCEAPEKMIHRPWFVLPPLQEFYYQKYHPEYKKLPPFREDCLGSQAYQNAGSLMSLEYPPENTALYIPIDLDGQSSQVVFKAVHRKPETKIYWHLDEQFLGITSHFHQLAHTPAPGRHRLVLVDEQGNRLQRYFNVLGKNG
jgi:penicillin-binding protein 1C